MVWCEFEYKDKREEEAEKERKWLILGLKLRQFPLYRIKAPLIGTIIETGRERIKSCVSERDMHAH